MSIRTNLVPEFATLCLLIVAACGSNGQTQPDAPPGDATPDELACDPPAPAVTDCAVAGSCPSFSIVGDPPATTPGSFKGHADPSLIQEPNAARTWLAYSWLSAQQGTNPAGDIVYMAAVENHLARSDDGGNTFVGAGVLWPAISMLDPEGSGEQGLISSETASLATLQQAGTTVWYGAHLRYFLRPVTGYNPNYATSWVVRIAAASTPIGLASAPEAVLGVTATADVYQPDVRLDQLAGLPRAHCAMLNNPEVFTEQDQLYLIVECLAFVGQTADYANTTTQVFATTPSGAPATWTWRHVGKLADDSLASELGQDTILQPDLARASDGTLLFILTPAHVDPNNHVGTTGVGCVAVELESIDPPVIRRDCAGRAVVRARADGEGIGACTYDAASSTGLTYTFHTGDGDDFSLHRSGRHP